MLDELQLEVFYIRTKIKGYLKNITENTKEIIDTIGIKNKNNISYNNNDILHKITVLDDKIILIRDNKEFSHRIIFKLNKEYQTEYYIKELNTSIDISIKTLELTKTDNKILITYQIIDSKDIYTYLIEMSDK